MAGEALLWYGMGWFVGERWYAPLPSSSQLIRLRRPAELPEYIYVGITEPSLHASSLPPTFSASHTGVQCLSAGLSFALGGSIAPPVMPFVSLKC